MRTTYCFEPNVVFENRNKAYGAFQLRHLYHRRVLTALAVATVAFTVGVASPTFIAKRHIDLPADTTEWKGQWINPPDQDPERKDVPPPVQEPPQPKIATERFLPPVPTEDEKVPDDEVIPGQDDLKGKQAGITTQEGDPNVDGGEAIVEDPPVTPADPGALGPKPETEKKDTDQPVLIAEQMPEYPGGDREMYEFLSKEVKYPEIARRAGIEGRVYLQFVIGRDGQIRDVEVVRGIGGGCDEEAARAIKAMPRWIPGRQRGTPVAVRYALPIRFGLR